MFGLVIINEGMEVNVPSRAYLLFIVCILLPVLREQLTKADSPPNICLLTIGCTLRTSGLKTTLLLSLFCFLLHVPWIFLFGVSTWCWTSTSWTSDQPNCLFVSIRIWNIASLCRGNLPFSYQIISFSNNNIYTVSYVTHLLFCPRLRKA